MRVSRTVKPRTSEEAKLLILPAFTYEEVNPRYPQPTYPMQIAFFSDDPRDLAAVVEAFGVQL
jgi:hypothetical protein